ncbi:MAG: hypothetical protein J7J46_06275 [Candidatus Desulfofervidus sp.]|nr:hypothetical protein [Candidatus Desulfofervidus sp.]
MKRVVIDVHKAIPIKDLGLVMQIWVDEIRRNFGVEVVETGTLRIYGGMLYIADDAPLTVEGTDEDIKRFMDVFGFTEGDVIKEELNK